MPAREVIAMQSFEDDVKHIKDGSLLGKMKKQIEKIINRPEVGKPLQYSMKGERTIYVKPYRIIYSFDSQRVFLLRFTHRKGAYKE